MKIFCAATLHRNNGQELINYAGEEKVGYDDVPYIFVEARPYSGNAYQRILNMFDYARHVKQMIYKCVKKEEKPDLILASSVHPFTLIAGIQIAKKLKVSCLCEIRDLWSETFISLGRLKANSLLAKFLYIGEKNIYKS